MKIETYEETAESGTDSLPPAPEDVVVQEKESEERSAQETAEEVAQEAPEEQEEVEEESEQADSEEAEETPENGESEEVSSLGGLLGFAVLGLLIMKAPAILDQLLGQNDDDQISVV